MSFGVAGFFPSAGAAVSARFPAASNTDTTPSAAVWVAFPAPSRLAVPRSPAGAVYPPVEVFGYACVPPVRSVNTSDDSVTFTCTNSDTFPAIGADAAHRAGRVGMVRVNHSGGTGNSRPCGSRTRKVRSACPPRS